MSIKWNFPSNQWGQRQGIGESGIELFKGKPIESLAREICQNSLDAAIGDMPVVIEFERFSIRSEDFPGKEDFEYALEKSEELWKQERNKKTTDFIKTAKKIVNDESISCLRISDYNTKGLTGSDKLINTDWINLLKAAGSSDKNSTAGGSYGIGKFAPFANSYLRTVFYATKDIDGLEATQGVARLVSFPISEEEGETTGIGYYGESERNTPIKECISLQKDYKRQDSGTDIYILGFTEMDDWIAKIIDEILAGFLYAVYLGTLEVKIEDLVLNKNNLAKVIEQYKDKLNLKTRAYYKVLTNGFTKWVETNAFHNSTIKLGLLFDEDNLPRSVAMIRKPWMKIKDQMGISSAISFSGLLIIEGDKLNEYLRKLENPQHVDWEPERLGNKSEIKTAKRLLKKIKGFIVNEFKKAIENDGVEQLDVEGAGEYLPYDTDGKTGKEIDRDVLNAKIESLKIKKVDAVKTSNKSVEDISKQEQKEMVKGGIIDEGEDTYTFEHEGKAKIKTVQEGEIPKGIDPNKDGLVYQYKTIKPINIKFMTVNKKNKQYRVVLNIPKPLSNFELSVFQLDEQGRKEKIEITEATVNKQDAKVNKNMISGESLNADKHNVIDFFVEQHETFSAEVLINGIEK